MKLPDAVESEIESLLEAPMTLPASSAQLGKAERVHDAEGRYLEFCKGTFPQATARCAACSSWSIARTAPTIASACASSRSWAPR